MKSSIILVRENESYRVLFGHLHLAGAFCSTREVCIEVKGEGTVKILKTGAGMFVKRKNRRLPSPEQLIPPSPSIAQAVLDRIVDQFGIVFHVHFFKHPRAVGADGLRAERHRLGDIGQ